MNRILKFGVVLVAGALLASPVTAQNWSDSLSGQTSQNTNTDQSGNRYSDQNRATQQSWNLPTYGQSNPGGNGGQGWNGPQNSSTSYNGQNGNRFDQTGLNRPDQFSPSFVALQMNNITRDLQQAGYSNVAIMPESFLVRAQDPNGRNIILFVNPDYSGQNDDDQMTAQGGPAEQGSGPSEQR